MYGKYGSHLHLMQTMHDLNDSSCVRMKYSNDENMQPLSHFS
jgi:hypothetical protein